MSMIPQTRIRKPYIYDYRSMKSSKSQKFKTYFIKLTEQPLFIWSITIVQILVFIAELCRNWLMTGTPIQIQPSFNFLIGPSVFILINMGARYPPCMHIIPGVTNNRSLSFPCPNFTGRIGEDLCSLNELCGFDNSPSPNQWYRFITAIFLHGGLIHITLNLFGQLSLAAAMEKKIGTFRLTVIYLTSGIFGNIVSGNFAADGFANVGCSGSLFGVLGLIFLDLFYNWHHNSCCELTILLISVILDLGIGLLPTVDNFAHISGFIMGFLLGFVLLKHPTKFCRRWKSNREIYINDHGILKKFCYNHPGKWWIWWMIRFLILIVIIIVFIWSIENIYSRKIRCSWCQYISCLPINGWCDVGQLKIIATINSASRTHVNITI